VTRNRDIKKDKFDWDNLTLRGKDAKYISLTEPWEKEYWTKTLEVDAEVIKKAIAETNSQNLEKIAIWIKNKKYK